MKFSATVQYKDSRAQWTFTKSIPRTDGLGFTDYSLDAVDFADAEQKARALYAKENATTPVRDTEDFMILFCDDPHTHRVIPW